LTAGLWPQISVSWEMETRFDRDWFEWRLIMPGIGREPGTGGAIPAADRRGAPHPCHGAGAPRLQPRQGVGRGRASEIVMLILRTLHCSRAAMVSTVTPELAMISFSQRRLRAIKVMRRARFSERIGRTARGDVDSGGRISRRRVDGVLRHGTSICWRRDFHAVNVRSRPFVSP